MNHQNIGNITVRQFAPEDAEALQRLIHFTVDACYPGHYPPEAIDHFKEYHSLETIARHAGKGLTIILEQDGDMIATGTWFREYIGRVFVLPAHQGRGLGLEIMRRLEQRARDNGDTHIHIEATPMAEPFYIKLGYRTLRNEFIPVANNQRLDYMYMEKRLDLSTAT